MPQLDCIIAHNLLACVALWLGQQLRFTLTVAYEATWYSQILVGRDLGLDPARQVAPEEHPLVLIGANEVLVSLENVCHCVPPGREELLYAIERLSDRESLTLALGAASKIHCLAPEFPAPGVAIHHLNAPQPFHPSG